MNTETLIGSGRTGRVYRIDGNPGAEVRKHFSPARSARLWNWFFYESPHPLTTEAGWDYSYWKRRLAHRLGEYIAESVHIVDATTPSYRGFISPFIEGNKPKKSELQTTHSLAARLERGFDDIGMPTWSFSRRNPFSASNFIINGDGTHIVDYEQSVPLPDIRGNLRYDEIYFDDVHAFIKENKPNMINHLGTDEVMNMEEAFSMAQEHHSRLDIRPRALSRLDKISRVLTRREMERTVENLYQEGKITEEELDSYRNGKTGELTRLAFMNLGVHCAIGLATAPWIFTPVSAALRPAWTAANWVRYSINGEYDKRSIHSWRVMAVSMLPLPFPFSAISNGAYIQSIMEQNAYIGIAVSDNLVREFTGMGLEEALGKVGSKRFVKPVVRAYERFPFTRPMLEPNAQHAHDILLSYLSADQNTTQNPK